MTHGVVEFGKWTVCVVSSATAWYLVWRLDGSGVGRSGITRDEYGPYGNPTLHTAEQKLAALEGAEDAVLLPSGMSAITTLLLAMLKPGDHVARVARFLESHPAIEHVYYPGLERDPDFPVARRQMTGFGGVVSFLVRGDYAATTRFIDR